MSLLAVNAPTAGWKATRQFQRDLRVSAQSARLTTRCGAATGSALQEKFGIEENVQFFKNDAGLDYVEMTHPSGSKATLYLLGACVTSWTLASGEDLLYVRPDAKFDGSKPISGGIPHCFPQFGPGKMQQHGFARNLVWSVVSTAANPNPDDVEPMIELQLEDSEDTAMWEAAKFCLNYTVTLKESGLTCQLRCVNTGESKSEFTAALHTYFSSGEGIESVRIGGLQGLPYLDKSVDPNNPSEGEEDRDLVSISGPTDSVYLGAPREVILDRGEGYTKISMQNNGEWKDAVVWSPWTVMEAAYPNFVCLEAARVKEPVSLDAGESWYAEMVLNAEQ